ncbi:MAG TPA: hypothetical protein VNG93_06580 [Candidatus Dormibacteraeota bacterium]|nr:hypothetical protein [Candidatus Dormibacteraeota bacterium]
MTFGDPPPWAFEICPGCGRDVLLETYDLSCPGDDSHPRFAVAWICNDCDAVLHTLGLFTAWAAATYARQAELDLRGFRYLAEHRGHADPVVTTESRQPGIK